MIEIELGKENSTWEVLHMRWLSCGRWLVALAMLGVGVVLGTPDLFAQAAGSEKVRFDTFDRVTLRGTFYPSSKGTKAPCVLLLHAIGGNSAQEGWGALAKGLQEKGFAVLAFDFRGHGDSREVDPKAFWGMGQNSKIKGFNASKPRSEINHKDFTMPYHYYWMVNDIAAAKRYLDNRNDNQECNSSNVIVIGAESGATLGAMWIASEWERRTGAPALPMVGAKTSVAGQEINCAVWLSITATLGNAKAPVESWIRAQSVKEKIPMYFVYGAQDVKTEKYAQHLYNDTLRAKTDKKVSKLTGLRGIEGTKLAGRDLLTKTLNTQELILAYVAKVIDDNGINTFERKETSKTPLYPVPVERFLK